MFHCSCVSIVILLVINEIMITGYLNTVLYLSSFVHNCVKCAIVPDDRVNATQILKSKVFAASEGSYGTIMLAVKTIYL